MSSDRKRRILPSASTEQKPELLLKAFWEGEADQRYERWILLLRVGKV